MTEDKTTLLEKEIARLNLIIEALVFENRALKLGYSINEKGNAPPAFGYSVSEKGNAPPAFGYSVSEKGNASPEFCYSVSEKGNAPPEFGYSINEKGNAPPEFGYSVSEKGNGTTDPGYSINEKENASPEFGYSVSEKGNGTTDLGYSVNEKRNASPEFGYSVDEKSNASPNLSYSVSEKGNTPAGSVRALPEKVEPTSAIVSRLKHKLRATETKKVRYAASENNAKLLIHFHNKNKSDHPTLRKLTGLSAGGLGKMIMSLTRRGLIVRDGWQRFALTPRAQQLLAGSLS